MGGNELFQERDLARVVHRVLDDSVQVGVNRHSGAHRRIAALADRLVQTIFVKRLEGQCQRTIRRVQPRSLRP